MITMLECPVCGEVLSIEVEARVNTPTYHYDGRQVQGTTELEYVRIRGIKPAAEREAWIIEQIYPHLKAGVTVDEISIILREEYRLCPIHIPAVIERIKEAYGLYTPDGKTLEMIK